MLFLADSTGKRPAKTFQNNIDFVCFLFASLCKTITGSRERAALDKRYQTTCFPTDHGTAGSSDVATCMDHICQLGGAGIVGFGSDFDGIGCTPAGLEHPGHIPALLDALRARGYDEEAIRGIAGENLVAYYNRIA